MLNKLDELIKCYKSKANNAIEERDKHYWRGRYITLLEVNSLMKNLKRYEFYDNFGLAKTRQSYDGEWVKFSDIYVILNSTTNKERITFCGCTENDIKETLVNGHRITVCKCGNMGINPPQNVSHLQ